MPHPSIETRGLVDDERYPAYRDDLQLYREQLIRDLTHRRNIDYPTMCGLLGEIRGLDYALAKPDELLKLDTPPVTP